jgi:hypothetical protein
MMRLLAVAFGLALVAPQFIYRPPIGPASVTWTTETYTGDVPNYLTQRTLHFDSVSGDWFTYSGLVGVTSGIYSSNFTFCNSASKVCVNAGGTSSVFNSTAPDYPASTAGQWNNGDGWTPGGPGPSDRHPDYQTITDTTRSKIVQVSGLLLGHTPNDFWEYSINSDPTDNRMSLVSTTATVFGTDASIGGTLIHIPSDDIFWIRFSNTLTAVLCRTASISSNQSAAGCVTQNVWASVSPTGATLPFAQLQNYVWDPATARILNFSFDNAGGTSADTTVYSYNPLTKVWTHMDPANKPTNVGGTDGFEWLVARVSTMPGQFVWVRTGHDNTANPGQAAVYRYDSLANTWTALSISGTGPSRISLITFDPTVGAYGAIIVHESDGGGQTGIIKHGAIGI